MAITVKLPVKIKMPRVSTQRSARGDRPAQLRQRRDVWQYSFPPPNVSGKHSTSAVWRGEDGTIYAGTMPEWAVFWALEQIGADFRYQSPFFGGRTVRGGAVVDFVIFSPVPRLLIRVQGIYYHLHQGGRRVAGDLIQKLALEAAGYSVIDIADTHALRDPLHYVREAFALRDHLKSA